MPKQPEVQPCRCGEVALYSYNEKVVEGRVVDVFVEDIACLDPECPEGKYVPTENVEFRYSQGNDPRVRAKRRR